MDIVVNKSVTHTETNGSIGYTLYAVKPYSATTGATVGALNIAEFDRTMAPVSAEYLSSVLAGFGYNHPANSTRIIDNRQAVLAVGEGPFPLPTIYAWGYSLSDTNNVEVIGVSLLPWDEGTLQILKTIHVEKQ
jgi:hypothetical protein